MARVKSVRTRQFKQLFDNLPSQIQEIARIKFEMFKENPFHPSFCRKVIQSTAHYPNPHYEFRITRDYRAACFTEEELAVFDLLTKPEMELTEYERSDVKAITQNLLETLKWEKLVLEKLALFRFLWRKRQQHAA